MTAYGAPRYADELERIAGHVVAVRPDPFRALAVLARVACRWPDDAVGAGWLMRRARRIEITLTFGEARGLLRSTRARRAA